MLYVMLAVGCFGVVCGVLAYTGRWQKWAERGAYLHYFGFSVLIFGAGLVCLGVAALVPREFGLVDALFLVWGTLILAGVLSFMWMPSFLLPRWFCEGREERREVERAMFEARKAEKAEKAERRRSAQ